MKIFLLKISMMTSSIIFVMKNPMSMGIMLLCQTIILTILMASIMSSSWLAMILFLMFVGGLLILFMYMSSIASNEKFNTNFKLMAIIIMLFIPMEELMSEKMITESEMMFKSEDSITLTKIYNRKTMMITITLFIYMFLAMIVVTSIIKLQKGPLRASLNK